jgi:hypothetical protein
VEVRDAGGTAAKPEADLLSKVPASDARCARGARRSDNDPLPTLRTFGAYLKNSETDDFVGCIGTARVLFMG